MTWSPQMVSETLGRRYGHAPINEAAFDVRVQLPESTNVQQLKNVGHGEAERYPAVEQINRLHNLVTFNPEQLSSDVQRTANGFLWRSTDSLQVIQARLDGFTFSRLRPYESWNAFSAEAFRLWRAYASVAMPRAVSRIALRYINQIDVSTADEPLLDMSAYLKTRPEISPLLPQTLEGYFSTLQLTLQESGPQLQLIQTVVAPSDNVLGLVLDIDVFWEENLNMDDGIDSRLMERFEILRDSKNAVFEACITDRTRELFN